MAPPNFKKKTPRDKKYLKWLLTQDCVLHMGFCFGDMIYHHTDTGGTALKGSDYSAIPVCFGHHETFNNASKKGVGIFEDGELATIITDSKSKYESETGRRCNE